MLSGKTSVYIDTTKSDDDVENQIQEVDGSQKEMPNSKAHIDSGQNTTKKKELDRSKYGKFIIHFEAGKSFGEIALISEDCVRNATVIADEDTNMLLIHRDLFNRSMKAEQEKEYEERKTFITNCPLFNDWSPKFKHLLEMSIRKKIYPYGTHITKQGEPVEGLFFIVSGQAKVMTEPARHYQQYPTIMVQTSALQQEFRRQNKENAERKLNGFAQKQVQVRRKEGYAAAERRYMSKNIELCSVEGNEIQGDMEMTLEMSTHSCTVISTATTTVFILDTKTYERLVFKKNTQTIVKLKQDVLQKLQSRITTSGVGNVPLLKILHDKLQQELKPEIREIPQKLRLNTDKHALLTQMIKLYLKDKVPLIEPLLPDSFSTRILSEWRNNFIEKKARKNEEHAAQQKQRRHRVPRSLKQLQSSAAETELLYPNKGWLHAERQLHDRHTRPKTAIGIESRSNIESEVSNRPETSSARGSYVFHLTECNTAEEVGQATIKEKSVFVTKDFDHVFQQIDSIQRGKNEARSKVICSVEAKKELREDNVCNHLDSIADDIYDLQDEDFFDYETSSSKLKRLEDRIKHFCTEVRQKKYNDPVRIDEMKCFHIKDSESVPVSGGTVFVSRKPCIYPRHAKISADVHQHIRRFIITREQNQYTSSNYSLAAKAHSTLSKRPKSAW